MATLWMWGQNSQGQLGQDNNIDYSSPVQVGSTDRWAVVALADRHTLAIKTGGTLWSWGRNTNGQLGDGTLISKSSPVQVGALTDWASVSAGSNFSHAIKTDGTLWAWGGYGDGQLGDGQNGPGYEESPIQIGSDTNWRMVDAGDRYCAAIRTDGTLWAWGHNTCGQLGLNDVTDRSSPTQVGALTNWAFVNTSGDYEGTCFTLAVKTDGTLWAWGDNTYGQLGNGENSNKYSSPIQIGALTNWVRVACGKSTSTALKTDGTLWSWGRNDNGQLGDDTTTHRSSPVQIGALTNWVGVGRGPEYAHAIKTDGTLWAWGYNSSGQLGDGTTTDRSSPVQIGALTDWVLTVDTTGSLTGDSAAMRSLNPLLDDIVLEWPYSGTVSLTIGIDAVLFGVQSYSKTLGLDAPLKKDRSRTVGVDAVLQKAGTETVDVDAILCGSKSKTLGLDAPLKKDRSKTVGIDAVIYETGVQTRTADIDAVLKKDRSRTVDIDTVLSLAGSGTIGTDAVLRLVKSKSIGFDANLYASRSRSLTVDADLYNLVGWAWGEQNTNYLEIPDIWDQWKDSGGSPADFDSSFGELTVGTGDVWYSDVKDFGSTSSKLITITIDKYGSGSGVQGTVEWRGSETSFAWDDPTPNWSSYPAGGSTETWRYVQVRVSK